jgi:hypothetical protein
MEITAVKALMLTTQQSLATQLSIHLKTPLVLQLTH